MNWSQSMPTPQTVFVTGASGFIAKHIVLKLLNAGYRVVGSVRSLSRGEEVRDAVAPHLDSAEGLDVRLRFVALDLNSDEGWDFSLAGCNILMHTASPFPLIQPDNEDEVIRPAVDGALRALTAAKAAGIARVVMTSSSVAVVNTGLPPGRSVYTEEDWTDLGHPGATAYAKSKTMAERAAWQFVETGAPDMQLTVINPVLVLGPPLDGNFGTSIAVIERILRSKDPMLPRFGMGVVDVRDVAEMHVRALTRDDTIGKRFIAVNRYMWLHEIAETLKAACPDRKIVTRVAPNIVMRLLAVFDKSIRTILPDLGKRHEISNARAREAMGLEFIDAEDSIRETATWLIEHKID